MKTALTFLTALFAAVSLCCIAATKAFGQEVKREGMNFTQVNTAQKSSDIKTEYTYTIREISYPVWVTKNGRCYILRISKNGNEYKQYLPEEVSRQIAEELGIEYKEAEKVGR